MTRRPSLAVPSLALALCLGVPASPASAAGHDEPVAGSAAEPAADATVGADATVPDTGLVVIAHPDLLMRSIDGEEIRRLFLGRSRRLPNGARAELASYAPAGAFFNERVLSSSDSQVATAWSRLRFSGRTPPPRVFDVAADVVAFVASTPNAIAYVPANVPREGVRVFYNVPR